jgi:hypothetical protein
MNDEQQVYHSEYIQKLLHSDLLQRNWNPDDYGAISAESNDDFTGSYLMFAFEDILNHTEKRSPIAQYNGTFPADVVEEILLEYFPFTAKQLHEILSEHYRAETNTYHYGSSRYLDSSVVAAVVGANQEVDGTLRLNYEVYSGLCFVPEAYTSKTPGVLTLKPNTDGGYIFCSVEVGEKIEAAKTRLGLRALVRGLVEETVWI